MLFLLTLEELANRGTPTCVGQISQLTDSIVQVLVRTNYEGVLVHWFIATAYSENDRIQNYIKHP